jgi:hypothetical protein
MEPNTCFTTTGVPFATDKSSKTLTINLASTGENHKQMNVRVLAAFLDALITAS